MLFMFAKRLGVLGGSLLGVALMFGGDPGRGGRVDDGAEVQRSAGPGHGDRVQRELERVSAGRREHRAPCRAPQCRRRSSGSRPAPRSGGWSSIAPSSLTDGAERRRHLQRHRPRPERVHHDRGKRGLLERCGEPLGDHGRGRPVRERSGSDRGHEPRERQLDRRRDPLLLRPGRPGDPRTQPGRRAGNTAELRLTSGAAGALRRDHAVSACRPTSAPRHDAGPWFGRWAHLGLNQGPPACEAGALPLSYAPGSV